MWIQQVQYNSTRRQWLQLHALYNLIILVEMWWLSESVGFLGPFSCNSQFLIYVKKSFELIFLNSFVFLFTLSLTQFHSHRNRHCLEVVQCFVRFHLEPIGNITQKHLSWLNKIDTTVTF